MTELKRRRRRAAPAGIAPNEPERDILDQYLYEVSTYPLLKGTEEIDLAKKIRAGDPDALQELVKRNLRFVISVAKKYQNRGLPLIDLIGEGNVGLLTAARKFDPDQGVKFISYAVWWIRQAILSALARQGRTVRVPLNRTADLSRIIKASEILRQKLNRRVVDCVLLDDCLEAALPVVMPELNIGHIERCPAFPLGRRYHFIRRDEEEFRFRIDELLDQPGARHSVHLHVLPGDPLHLFTS